MKRMHTVASWAPPAQAATLPPGAERQTAQPARPATLASDVLVPLVQAGVTGALLAGLLVLGIGELVPDFDGDLLKLWGAAALGISTVAWLLLLGQTRRLLWALEKVTQLDLDGDRQVGQPQERVVIVNAGQAEREAASRGNAHRASQFAQFVAALPARGTAMDDWSDLGRETYTDYRDALIRLGWAAWNSTKKDGTPNKKQGWALTLPADEILRRISG